MDHPPRSRPLCRKVYVGGLGNNGTTYEIRNAFCQYGPLKRVWVARNPPGFAFVDFVDSSDAQNAITALDGTILCGRRVRVSFANRNSRSTSRGQSRNAPTRNSIQESCYACGESGHYVRDCYVHQIAMLGLEDEYEYELDSEYFDSDDDDICYYEGLPELYLREDFYEFLHAQLEARNQESSSQNSRNSAQQQHRNERPREQRRSDGRQEQRRYNRPQEQSRNDRPQEHFRNNQSQEHCISNSTPSASSKTNSALGEVKCVICLDTVEGEMEHLPCRHGFHAECCNKWLSNSDICPICRTKVGSRLDQVSVDQMCPIS